MVIDRITFGKVIPGLAFFHIPVPEFMLMWNGNTTYGRLDGTKEKGGFFYREKLILFFCEDTGVCCFSVNTGLFAAFKEMGNIISVHCGT